MNEQQRTCCFYDPLLRVGCGAMENRVCEKRTCTMHMTELDLKANRRASKKRRRMLLLRYARMLGFTITMKEVVAWDADD